MSYLDIIKKMNNFDNSTHAIISKGKELENMYFKDDPSYRSAILYKFDLTYEPIDIRIKNIDKSVNSKKFILRPDTLVGAGNYISYGDKSYIVDEYEENSTSPYCKVVLCNQFLQLDKNNKIPCIVEGESYGVKIFQANNDFISETDTKVKITVPRNSITLNIKVDTRFIFGNSEFGIYKIGDIATYQEGLLVFIAKKDKYKPEYDDLENNLAWNGETITPEPTDYEILGEDSVRVNDSYTYTLSPTSTNTSWSLDDFTINNNIAEINIIDDNTVTVKGLKSGEYFELTCEVDGKQIIKEIMVVR